MAFGKKDKSEEEGERESKLTPDEWLAKAESTMRKVSGINEMGGRAATMANANATISLVYEVRRINELLERLIAKG